MTKFNVFCKIINPVAKFNSPTEINDDYGYLNVSPAGVLTWKLNDKILSMNHDDIKFIHKKVRELIKSIPSGSKYVETTDTESGFGVERKDS